MSPVYAKKRIDRDRDSKNDIMISECGNDIRSDNLNRLDSLRVSQDLETALDL